MSARTTPSILWSRPPCSWITWSSFLLETEELSSTRSFLFVLNKVLRFASSTMRYSLLDSLRCLPSNRKPRSMVRPAEYDFPCLFTKKILPVVWFYMYSLKKKKIKRNFVLKILILLFILRIENDISLIGLYSNRFDDNTLEKGKDVSMDC